MKPGIPDGRKALWTVIIGCALALIAARAWAGPPFLTDDPEPVELHHWEVYLASQYENVKGAGFDTTAPHVEINYGALPNTQIHLIVPMVYAHPAGGPAAYGPGDMETGVKYRFYNDVGTGFQAGTFPLLTLPTGSRSRGLGEGHPNLFLPIWLQKAWGHWLAYGGGGYWIHPGADNKNYWFTGLEVQRDITRTLTLGAEVFNQTASARDETSSTGFNAGAIVNITGIHHILFSAGRDLSGPVRYRMYAAYQLTFGP